MTKYLLRKLINSFFVLLGVVSLVFIIFQVMPGDTVSMMVGQRSDPSTKKAIVQEYGLDKSLGTQFLHYINDLSPVSFHEDTKKNEEKYAYAKVLSFRKVAMVLKKPYLRRSFQDNRLVSEIIVESFIRTFWLALSAMIFASIIGISLGVLAALKQNSFLDRFLVTSSILGISIPSFVAGVLIAFLFAIKWHHITHLNLFGYLIEIDPFTGKHLELKNLILPAITLGIRPLAIIVQLTRGAMLDVMKEDYIRTAKAKGLSATKVLLRHALRNAMNPVVTVISGWFASLLAGAFFVEIIFSWGGLGSVTIQAVFSKNFPVIMGATIVVATLFVIINILVDLLYAWLDPRIRLK